MEGDSNHQKEKKERTDAQKQALLKARERAVEVRQQNAELRRKEAEVTRAKEAAEKVARREQIEKEYDDMHKQEPEEEEEVVVQKKPKKVKRRVVVVQDSSSSEEEIEVRLPKAKQKKTADQSMYERSMQKMFTLG
jgi:hypothetical protein